MSGFRANLEKRGVSLFEVMVAIGLLLLASVILMKVLVPSLRIGGEMQRRADFRQQALLAGRWLELDLRLGSPAAIGILSNPVVMAVQPPREMALDGSILWDQRLIVYSHSNLELKRGEWTGSPSLSTPLSQTRPSRVSQTDLQLLGSWNTSSRVLARNVLSFAVSHGGVGESVGTPLRLEMEFRNPDSPEEFFKFQKIISPRMGE